MATGISRKQFVFYGGAEDKSFELLLKSLADWFIDNPAVSWERQLRDARAVARQEAYAY